jgi:hypothetical protein
MARYRCYLLGSNDQLVATETIEGSTDEEATVKARRLLAERPFATAFELRLGDHRVTSEASFAP